VLQWDGPLENSKGNFDICVRQFIDLLGEVVTFRIEVENHTAYRLAEVWHGFLGGLTGMGDRADTQTIIPLKGWANSTSLFQQFPETMGVGAFGGMRFPEFYYRYPSPLSMPWMTMYNPELNRGAYFGCHDTTARALVLRGELHPGMARNRQGTNWPSPQESAELADRYPVGLVLHWANLPYIEPGQTFHGPCVTLCCYEGDWHKASKLYRTWFTSNFPVRASRHNWLRAQQAVQVSMLLLPEDNLIFTFKDIEQWARDALDYGVKAVLISGWNVGGHDRGYPDYTPDSRLGTWRELADAIRACHRMGVKIYFFANIQPVDITPGKQDRNWSAYQTTNARGQGKVMGWGMGTLSARMGDSSTPLAYCNPSIPEFRRILVHQMRKLAEIGADGVHLDKVWPSTAMDFNPNLDGSPDRTIMEGLLDCLQEIIDACREVNPQFCLGVESSWDRTLQYVDGWWNWHDMVDHTAVMKYTFPEYMPTFTVVQPWDYNTVNASIRYGYQLLIGPIRFSSSMNDEQMRPLSQYISEVLRIRDAVRETIFFGTFLDNLQVLVETDPCVKYSTFCRPDTGQRACVLVNTDTKPHKASLRFDPSVSTKARVYQPFTDVESAELPITRMIPAERLMIVIENGGAGPV